MNKTGLILWEMDMMDSITCGIIFVIKTTDDNRRRQSKNQFMKVQTMKKNNVINQFLKTFMFITAIKELIK